MKKTITLSENEAFRLWLASIPDTSHVYQHTKAKLFEAFGGEKNKLYQEWSKKGV